MHNHVKVARIRNSIALYDNDSILVTSPARIVPIVEIVTELHTLQQSETMTDWRDPIDSNKKLVEELAAMATT